MRVISITELAGQFYANVETRGGKRYATTYANEPTEDEVLEDFTENKGAFMHVN